MSFLGILRQCNTNGTHQDFCIQQFFDEVDSLKTKVENLEWSKAQNEERVPSGSVLTGFSKGSFTPGDQTFMRPWILSSNCHWSLKPSGCLFQGSPCFLSGNDRFEVTGFQATRVFCQWLLEVWKSGVEPVGGPLSNGSRGEGSLFSRCLSQL